MSQPDVVDVVALARSFGSIEGKLPLAGLGRLEDVLIDRSGTLTYLLEGLVGEKGESLLRLKVGGSVVLQCQRCLEPLIHAVVIDTELELVAPEADLTQDELENDSRDYLPVTGPIKIATLVEDEIILALPSAPRHDDCGKSSGCGSAEVVTAFAVLAGLKRRIH